MFITSFISVAIVLLHRGGLSISQSVIISVATAAVSAVVELYSKNGMDTVFCPICAMIVLDGLTLIF